MGDDGHRLPWTDEQWAAVQRVVQDAARRARVASSFLPLVGPLAPGQATVPALPMSHSAPLHDWFGDGAAQRLAVDDGATLRLATIASDVYLKVVEAEDPELAAARQMLSRAADIIGRLEDAIIFNGLPAPPDRIPRRHKGGFPWVRPEIYTVHGGTVEGDPPHPGLLTHDGALHREVEPESGENQGQALVRAVVAAIADLEEQGHYGPFACVLGHDLYVAANTPNRDSMVLPSDRILPFLDGPLLRSSSIPGNRGVVVALAGSPIDLVIGSDVHVSYVQLSMEPRHVLRVSTRFVLRMKQPDAVCRLEGPAAEARREDMTPEKQNS